MLIEVSSKEDICVDHCFYTNIQMINLNFELKISYNHILAIVTQNYAYEFVISNKIADIKTLKNNQISYF